MDNYTSNAYRNSEEKEDSQRREDPSKSRTKSLFDNLKEGAEQGAREAYETKISIEDVRDFREQIQRQPDPIIGKSLDDLLNTITDFIEKNPNEYVLIKLLWVITMLAGPKALGGFGKSLMTVGLLKSLAEKE